MKFSICFLTLIALRSLVFSYTARMNLVLSPSELRVQADYTFAGNSLKLALPGRARLLSIASSSGNSVTFYQNGHTLLIDNVQSNYGGMINLVYTLSVGEEEFYSDDWLIHPDEKGTVNADLSLPEGVKGVIFPFIGRKGDGFTLDADEKPLLICGRFQETADSARGRTYDVFYHGKNMSTIADIDRLFAAYENLLFGLDQSNIVIVDLPALPGTMRFEKNNIFLITGGTNPGEIKYAVSGLFFKGLIKFDGNELFAYSDLYKRLVGDNGRINTDEAYLVPVPGHSYYEDVIRNGFTTKGEITCDTGDMLKNFAMLHFALFTTGIDSYTNLVKNYILGKINPVSNISESLSEICESSGTNNEAAVQIAKYFLPVSAIVPDISIKRTTAVRNSDNIPDIDEMAGSNIIGINWEGKRVYEINVRGGIIILDPQRVVPRLDFENDISVLDPHEAAERAAAREAAVKHRHYSDETPRNVLYLEKFEYPKSTTLKLPPDGSVYVAIVRFFAPVRGKLIEGLKEMVISVKNGKGFVVQDRIRL